MILVIFGQPASGKTTIAKFFKENGFHNIDGDELRQIFNNTDYSKSGRINNLNRASDIAIYLNQYQNIVLSLVYPYQECRDYLNSLTTDIKWVFLTHENNRGKDNFKVVDFETPNLSNVDLCINTTVISIQDSITQINEICKLH